jgi:putative SOS response-associated peptidase YedK
MCGRYDLFDTGKLPQRFKTINTITDLKPSYNITPGQKLPVITNQAKIEILQWGLIPYWASDPKIGYNLINARAETVAIKPGFRKAFRFQRCLVPANGFYEWEKIPEGKVPYHIELSGKPLFAFAGLFDIWKDQQGKEIKTYTIITTEPNAVVAPIHNRMPVVLTPEHEADWLSTQITEPEKLMGFLKPYQEKDMIAYRVSYSVNNPENNNETLISKI